MAPRPPLLLRLIGRLPGPLRAGLMRALNAAGLVVLGAKMRAVHRRLLEFQGLEASPAALDELMRRFSAYYARSVANLFRICATLPARAPVPVDLPALPQIEKLRARGKGVILATPHFGDLYSAILALGERVPLTVLMVTGERYKWAESGTLKFVEFLGGAIEVISALERNECVLVYDDLDFIPGNRTANLFGAPVFPPHGPARLALATGAAILPIAALWSPDRATVVCDEPILPEDKTQEQLEDGCLRAIERLVLRAPEQWMILHDPWDLDAMRKVAEGFRARAVAKAKR